jgi:hypothetical protein
MTIPLLSCYPLTWGISCGLCIPNTYMDLNGCHSRFVLLLRLGVRKTYYIITTLDIIEIQCEYCVRSQSIISPTVVSERVRLSSLSQKAASRVFALSIFIRYN